jgi:hypothetical protein
MRKIVIDVYATEKHCCEKNRKLSGYNKCFCCITGHTTIHDEILIEYHCLAFRQGTTMGMDCIKGGYFPRRWQECINADFKTLLEKEGQRILDAMHSAFVTSHRRVKNTGSPYKNHKNKNR